MDLMFLFWSISVGIICGAGFAIFAVALCIVLTIAIVILDRLPVAHAPMILVVNASDINIEDKVMAKVAEYVKHSSVKSRNMTSTTLDLTFELRTDNGGKLVRDLMEVPGVTYASLLSHDGEVTF